MVPQMIPAFVSFSIYRWDINVCISTIIGLVGGGIGFLLVRHIRLLRYRSAGVAVWFIAITVDILDYVSADIRQRFFRRNSLSEVGTNHTWEKHRRTRGLAHAWFHAGR